MKKLTTLARRCDLNDSELETLIRFCRKRSITNREMKIIEKALNAGKSIEDSVNELDQWERNRPVLIVDKEDYEQKYKRAKKKYGIDSMYDFYKLIVQGDIEGPEVFQPIETEEL